MFVTISDLPGLGCLSRQVMKGYKGCVVCMEDMDASWMKNNNKMVYMGHRRFLSMEHPYRKNKKSFYGKIKDRLAPWTLFAKDILTKVNKLKVILRKGNEANRHRGLLCSKRNRYSGICLIGGSWMFTTHLMGCTSLKT